jgi:hypothetical protein
VAAGQVSGANGHAYRRGEQPRMANKIIVKNKINKGPKDNRIANDRGVGSTVLLGSIVLLNFFKFDSMFSNSVPALQPAQ